MPISRRLFAKSALAFGVASAFTPRSASAAAPAFVAATTSSDLNGSSAYLVTIPSHSNGDLLVIMIATTAGASPMTAINTPSGWTKEEDVEAGAASAVRLTCFTKAGNGTEDEVVLSSVSNCAYLAICAAYSGAESSSDITGSAVQDTGVDMTAPSVTTTVANTRVIYAFCFDDDVSTDADVATDAGFNGTKRGYIETSGGSLGDNGATICLSDEAQASSGASNTCVFSTNADDDAGCAITIALASSSSQSVVPILDSHRRRRAQ